MKSAYSLKSVYSRVGRWSSDAELVQRLADSVVFFDPKVDTTGLMVINKPYGLPAKKCEDSPVSLQDILPQLQRQLELNQLYIIKTAERFSSGLTFLGTKPETRERFAARRSSQAFLADKHLAITSGFPRMGDAHETVSVKLTPIENVAKTEGISMGKIAQEPVIHRGGFSKRAHHRGEAVLREVRLETLARSAKGPAALVAVAPNSTGKHFVPVYLADQLSPIVGEELYNYRVRTIMGVPTKVSHNHSPHQRQTIFPDWLMERLGLHRGDERCVPKHLHLFRAHLHNYLGKGKSLTVFAPPPQHFHATCKRLEIELNVDDLMAEDVVRERLRQAKVSAARHKVNADEADKLEKEILESQTFTKMKT